jgi:hypothetical protein
VAAVRAGCLGSVVLAAALLAGCGGSQSDNASKTSKASNASAQVCAARDDIAKQVEQLQNVTVSIATTSQIKDGLGAIKDDLSKIAGAQGDLSEQRRNDVRAANEQFSASVKQAVEDVPTTASLHGAKAQVEQGLKQLGDSYRSTFAKISCP